mmetsp:Transcript_37655/g.60300  ORF Transcript_37655/g.60300 Transcript_37655/m.60300 type:complete len:360 (+) Transcript_37655:42-1121(+)
MIANTKPNQYGADRNISTKLQIKKVNSKTVRTKQQRVSVHKNTTNASQYISLFVVFIGAISQIPLHRTIRQRHTHISQTQLRHSPSTQHLFRQFMILPSLNSKRDIIDRLIRVILDQIQPLLGSIRPRMNIDIHCKVTILLIIKLRARLRQKRLGVVLFDQLIGHKSKLGVLAIHHSRHTLKPLAHSVHLLLVAAYKVTQQLDRRRDSHRLARLALCAVARHLVMHVLAEMRIDDAAVSRSVVLHFAFLAQRARRLRHFRIVVGNHHVDDEQRRQCVVCVVGVQVVWHRVALHDALEFVAVGAECGVHIMPDLVHLGLVELEAFEFEDGVQCCLGGLFLTVCVVWTATHVEGGRVDVAP